MSPLRRSDGIITCCCPIMGTHLRNNYFTWIMTNNPYVKTLIEMGYDESDCRVSRNETVPRTIYGHTYDTKEEYDEAMADFLNGL